MQSKIYSFEQHRLPLERIDKDALFIMERLRKAGHTAYLVGGSVRDLLLQRRPKDFDISTSARPEEIKQLFRSCILIGRRFRLAHIRFGHKVFEVSTFRAGDNEADTLILRDNIWGSPEEDVLRRDFTINGLFFDSGNQTILDYIDGYSDLQRRYLRTIGQPYLRFRQDPVRMLRLLKFQARFGFEVDPEAHVALLECRTEITKSAPARILEELLRMLESGASAPFFRVLSTHGFLQLLMPTLSSFLTASNGEEIFSMLEEADRMLQAPHPHALRRPVLLSCLLFSPLYARIQMQYLDRGHVPHLGDIQLQAQQLIHEMFAPFLSLPKRTKYSLLAILCAQFRFTPLDNRPLRRPRIPKDPEFSHALRFFELRSTLEPALQQTLQRWEEAYQSFAQTNRGHTSRAHPHS